MNGQAVKANLKEAASSLAASMQRSLLALIGISIGIGSVIAILSVGTIVQDEAARQFRELGTDILNIRLSDRGAGTRRRAGPLLALEDAVGLATLPTIAAVAPYVTAPEARAVVAGENVENIAVLGVTEAFADLQKLRVEDGRFISDLDGRRPFCVVGAEIAAAMRGSGAGSIVGKTIRIDGAVFTAVGVLPRTPRGRRRYDVNRSVIIPLVTSQRVFSRPGIRRITARMSPNAHHLDAAAEVEAYIRRKVKDARIRVNSAEELIERMQRHSRLFTILLGVVGGISLLVGGIGVMNVMLVSVAERRREIGIRRALGARRMDIQSQFLIESVILSMLGGVFGVALGVGATYALCHFTGWTFGISAMAAGLGIGVSGSAGVFFGYYPAWQAARLDLVAALRGP